MMRVQSTVEYILFIGIVVILALVAGSGVISLLRGVKDASDLIHGFTKQTGVSLNALT